MIKNFIYDPDRKVDTWSIMRPGADGAYRGDCDDYAVTTLYLYTGSLWRFWASLIFGSAKIHFVTTVDGGGHAVLQYNGMYIDNWTQSWVSRNHMETVCGHEFSSWLFPWPTTALKMLLGKLRL